jgi:AraC-like DNA-binding protein
MDAIYSNYAPTFLYVDKYQFSDKWAYQESRVPYSMFRYICSGSAEFTVNGISYTVMQDDVFYIPQGSTLQCKALENIVFISVRFVGSMQLSDEDMLEQLWNITQQYNFKDSPEMKIWFEKMYQSAVSKATYKRLETRGYLNLICAELARRSGKNEETEEALKQDRTTAAMFDMKYIRNRVKASHQNIDPRVQILVDYITVHPEENLTREKMCRMTGVSESTLRRLFKALMGKSIYEFIMDTKMIYATHLLATTLEPISEIGYQLGYESPSYFTKRFRENFGISPQAYRKLSKET